MWQRVAHRRMPTNSPLSYIHALPPRRTFPDLNAINFMKPDHCIDVCNRLLRGERSAVETYDKAIEKYGSEPAAATLRRIRDEHALAV
jgi:hypothetical protein